jgi:hypothetical protein
MGPEVANGIIIADEKGRPWKLTKYVRHDGRGEAVSIRMLCQNSELIGTRS